MANAIGNNDAPKTAIAAAPTIIIGAAVCNKNAAPTNPPKTIALFAILSHSTVAKFCNAFEDIHNAPDKTTNAAAPVIAVVLNDDKPSPIPFNTFFIAVPIPRDNDFIAFSTIETTSPNTVFSVLNNDFTIPNS